MGQIPDKIEIRLKAFHQSLMIAFKRGIWQIKCSMDIAFFIVLALLAYVYLGFPSLLALLSLLPATKAAGGNLPRVAVLIPAHNEGSRIREKLLNTLCCDYPADRLEIWVGADGCTDNTEAEIRAVDDKRIRLVSEFSRVGKTRIMNRLAKEAKAEVLVLTDADIWVAPDALRRISAWFGNPRVGAVCGRRSDRTDRMEGLSWPARLYNRYESAIKRGEGRLGRVLGADGCLYAVRREYYCPVPPGVPDDFVTVLRVLEAGYRVLYENEAESRETLSSDAGYQFRRKRRTVARGLRGLWCVRGLINPLRHPYTGFLLLSHKLLRWCTPFLMLMAFALNAGLAFHSYYGAILVAQVLFYCLALLPLIVPLAGRVRTIQAIRYFVLVNAATATAWLDVLLGRTWEQWESV